MVDAPTMRATVIREHGGYDKVRVERFPKPSVREPGDVVVRVRACALNRLDVFARQGLSGSGVRAVRLPHISGVDVAGEVAEAGPGVWGWRPGDRVVLYSGLTCGHCEFCARGEETMCSAYRIFGEDTHGGLAEYCRIPASNLEPLPDHIPFELAAAAPTACTTAWRMAVTVGNLRPHERVLVLGDGGRTDRPHDGGVRHRGHQRKGPGAASRGDRGQQDGRPPDRGLRIRRGGGDRRARSGVGDQPRWRIHLAACDKESGTGREDAMLRGNLRV